MNRRTALGALAVLPIGVVGVTSGDRTRQDQGWRPLFNGRDLDGWDTFLGKPHQSTDVAGLSRNAAGEYTDVIGVNRDPRGVFSVVTADGAPAIRISGEVYGALTSRAEFENYHLRFEFKWGGKRWPPREDAVRDSGCCYHAVGPHGASYGFWMRSFEFQIQEGDCGDFYSLAGVIVDVEAARDRADPKGELVYSRGAPAVVGHTKRVIRSPFNEKPRGEWNSMELYCVGQASAHVVNGKVNMRLTGLRHRVDDHEVPLTKGRIQLQSEAAEVFYRNLEIRPVDRMPGLPPSA